MAGTPNTELERDLRERLTGVDLVCQADLPDEQLDHAEAICREAFVAGAIAALPTRSPATFVSYVAIRGAERYEGNAVWRQLGVTTASSRVGQAFLQALRRLGLPDFHKMVEAENARTYVAPILIHGGLAADHAPALVERLVTELNRGLVDGREAVHRIAADRGLLGRPVERLVRYAPEYAADLFDGLVDHITGSVTSSAGALPRHLRSALDVDSAGPRRRLRRLAIPTVSFDPWGGFGPEVSCAADGPTWAVDESGRTRILAPGDVLIVEPSHRLAVRGQGQHRVLWRRPVLWFSDVDSLVPPDSPLPAIATALVPPGWRLHVGGGRPLPIVEQGVGLTGPWSRYHAMVVDLRSCREVTAEPPEGTYEQQARWPVSSSTEPTVIGEQVEGAVAAGGGPVFRSTPRAHVGYDDRAIPAWFTASGEATVHRLFDPSELEGGGLDLSEWLGEGPLAGTLEIRGPDDRRRPLPLAVVPALTVTGLERPLDPEATASVRVTADPRLGDRLDREMSVPPGVDQVELPVPGLPEGSVRLAVPRVQWALRSNTRRRLDLAPGVIRTDVDALLSSDVVLLVRCGRRAQAELTLHIDGQVAQTGPGRSLHDAAGRHHQCAFGLARYADTLRKHRDDVIELRIEVDGISMLAVACGASAGATPAATTRSWAVSGSAAPTRQAAAPWADVGWIADARRHESPVASIGSVEARDLAVELARRLEPLPHGDVLVMFVSELGRASRRWPSGISSTSAPGSTEGPGGPEWSAFEAVADELWHLGGLRYRTFAGRPLIDALHGWARRTKELARRRAQADRQAIELWSVGRLPPVDRMAAWRHTVWIGACAPRRPYGWSGVDWLPAALLFRVLTLAGGDDHAGPAVAEAVGLVPEAVLETVAFLLEAVRRGERLRRFEPTEEDELDHDGDDTDAAPAPAPIPATTHHLSLSRLDPAAVQVVGRQLVIRGSAAASAPWLRLSTDSHARALLSATADADDLVASVPPDLAGTHQLTPVDPRSTGLSSSPGLEIDLPASTPAPALAVAVRGGDLTALNELRCQALVAQVAHAVETQRTSEAPVDELFDNESAAAAALVSFARTAGQNDVADRIGIAVLPMAMLFSAGLVPRDRAEHGLCRRAPLLWAALAPREALLWRPLGWPNQNGFSAGTSWYDDVVAFARKRHHAADGAVRPPSVRYDLAARVVADRHIHRTIQALDRRGLDRSFVDLVTVTFAAITIDAVSPEATRLLVAAHHLVPQLTTNAALVGIALHLATVTRN